MPATRLPIIGYPLPRTVLEGVLRKALAEAGSPIQIEARRVPTFKAGKEQALGAVVGWVMKQSKGQANPAKVNGMLRRKIS